MLNGLDPQAWPTKVLPRIPEHPNDHIEKSLPWNCRPDHVPSAAA